MIKTLHIGEKDVRLSNNAGWAIEYRSQFGQDIISTLTPMLAAVLDLTSGFLQEVGVDRGSVELVDMLKVLDGDRAIDIVAHLSGLEFVDFINIVWAMAKAADDDIPEPRIWIRQFEVFPVDEVAPEVLKLAFSGLVSRKNLKRLRDMLRSIKVTQPLTSIPSSSQDLNED